MASPVGIFMVMGGVTLLTSLLPGTLLPTRPPSGTDLEQMIQPRAIFGHWINAAALQGVGQGKRLAEVLDWRAVQPLLPGGEEAEVEAIELGWCFACLDAGQVDLARARLRSMVARLDDDSPGWLRTDVFNQLGCLSALEGDPVYAQACLSEVRLTQSTEWYCELLVACIAKAQGDAGSLVRGVAEVARGGRGLPGAGVRPRRQPVGAGTAGVTSLSPDGLTRRVRRGSGGPRRAARRPGCAASRSLLRAA